MAVSVDNILPAGWLNVFSTAHPRIAVGIDPATTTRKKSNPTGIVVTQQVGQFYYERLVIRMKTEDPDVIERLLKLIGEGLRSIGLAIRKVVIRATNERFFAVKLRKTLVGRMPVEMVIESEIIVYLGQKMTYKAYLGNLVVNTIDDGYLPLPPAEWLKRDFRSVNKERGTFEAEILDDGGHGDCFDGAGCALHGLISKGGRAQATASGPGRFLAGGAPARKVLNPFAHKFTGRPGGLAT